MINYVKEANTAIFTGPTSCGKTRRVLDLIEKEYQESLRKCRDFVPYAEVEYDLP